MGKCHIFVIIDMSPPSHTMFTWILSCLIADDPNAIKDLMQMRLTGGGGGMMAEKLEVNNIWTSHIYMIVSFVLYIAYV